ncbi:hypothetical protein CH367_07845 [Leptospira barantonii]|uniref:Restriction alleviation protein, Lar family n=1 Tax=Leptospira barantonii TaxID=2023184 RepID=A0ABX4NNP7_9LEPT|nr:hypothetical protein CH367_07845 [Leptospira barantonii]
MSKYYSSNIHLKACPNCNHWFGIDTKKRFDGVNRGWLFRIVCKSCKLQTEEFNILEEAKLAWNIMNSNS